MAVMAVMALTANAQKINGSFGFETAHLWRGYEVSDGFTLTANTSVTFADKFTVGLWGGRELDGSYKEFDYYAQFSTNGFTVALWDIYNNSAGQSRHGYTEAMWQNVFNYNKHSTGHFLDAEVSYNFAPACNVPLTLAWNTIIQGRDLDNDNETQQYTTYVKATYTVFENEHVAVTPAIGGAFKFAGDGKCNFYDGKHKAGITDIDLAFTYKAHLGKYELPLTATAVWSPSQKSGHMAVSATLLSF